MEPALLKIVMICDLESVCRRSRQGKLQHTLLFIVITRFSSAQHRQDVPEGKFLFGKVKPTRLFSVPVSDGLECRVRHAENMELLLMPQPRQRLLADERFADSFANDAKASHKKIREASYEAGSVHPISLDYITRRSAQAPRPGRPPQQVFDALPKRKMRTIAKRGDLLREGDTVEHLFVVVDGWGCRYKSTSDGARQIIGFLIPGDICNPEHIHNARSSYAVGAITKLTIASCRLDLVQQEIRNDERVSRLIWSDAAKISDRERNWLLNIGQRDAAICTAHLICELIERLDRVGMLRGGVCMFPIAQHDIAAATGLSSVHVNRTLGDLRRRGLIAFKGRSMAVLDRSRLEHLCLFEAASSRSSPRPFPPT